MNWDAIGAVGEIVGALAVVASLLYLGRQVREGARATRAETELEAARMWSDFHARVAHSPDMSSIWDRGHRDPATLTEPDRQRFVWLVAEYVFLVEGLFKQYRRGFLSGDSWEQHERTLIGLFDNPIVQGWWSSGVSPYSREFIAHVDTAVTKGSAAKWGYTALAELGQADQDEQTPAMEEEGQQTTGRGE